MTMSTQSGFLMLADLSGFTEFLTTTELEHGPAVANDLLGAVMESLAAQLHVENVQGDAVFAIAPDGTFARPPTVLDAIEQSFFAFKDRQRQMRLATSCTCNACRSIPRLQLKFVLHHGSFVRQAVGDRTQLGGSDVIVVHRLLKNSVAGIPCYLLATARATHAMGLDPDTAAMRRHVESYEHLGEVECFVADLEPIWAAFDEARSHRLGPGDAPLEAEAIIAAPPAVAWDWLNVPANRVRYTPGMKGLREEGLVRGKLGVGTVLHCDHGKQQVPMRIIDWKPPRYFTVEIPIPIGRVWSTIELAAEGAGTRVAMRMAPAAGSPAPFRWVFRYVMTRMMRRDCEALVRAIGQELENDLARAGAGVAAPPEGLAGADA